MSNKDNFKTWLDTKSVQTPTPAVPNTLYKTAYSKNITVEEWNSLIQYINRAVAKTNSWLTGFQESYDATPDLSVVCNLKDNTIPVWDTSAQKFVNSTIEVADGLVKVANSVDKSRMDIDKNSFTVYTGSKDTGVKFKLPELRSGVAEVSLLTDALPIRAGSGANAVVVNDISGETSNVAYSENTTAFGTGNSVGLKGYFYSDNAIDFENKTITLSTAHENGEAVNCAYEAGYVISIVNDIKYESCSTITAVNGNVITVDNLPFTEIVTGCSDFEDYSIYCPEHPEIGVADLGKNSAVFGKDNAVHNAFNFVSGNNNSAVGAYATVFGNRNKSGYGNLVQGVDNTWLGQKGAAFGERHTSSANRAYTVGLNNKHNARLTFSAGTDNVLNSERQFVQGVGNTVEGKYGFVSGDGNNISSAYTHVLGNRNTVNVTDSISEITYSDVVVGSSNTVTRKWAGAFGNRNTVKSFGGYAFGIGLSSPPKIGGSSYTPYQILLGAYNASSGLSEYEAQVVVGGGTPSAPKTLATLSTDGDLHLAGNQITLRDSDGSDISIDSVGVKELDKFRENVGIFTALTMFKTDTAFAGKVTMAKDLTVAGNFKVTGTTTVQDVKNLAVEDLTITLSKNAPLGVSLAGIIVPDYNGMSQPGGLVFDDTGTAYVGDVSVSSDGVVTQGDARPIAVRSDAVEWSENSIPRWSSTFDGFEPSGFTTGTFAQKLDKIETVAGEHKIYTSINGVQGSVDIATTPDVDGIPIYGTGGVLLVNAGTGNRHCVNLKQMNDALAKKLDLVTPTYPSLYGATKEGQRQYLINNTPNTGYIPQYAVGGILRTNTGVADTDCINLKQMKDYVPVKAGTPTNSLTNNDSNTLISEGAVAFGSNNIAGQKGYYWSEIDTTNKTITLATKHTGGEPVTCEYEVGDSIYVNSGGYLSTNITITAINDSVITYSGSIDIHNASGAPRDEVIYCVDKSSVGLVDIGLYTFTSGESNQAGCCSVGIGTQNVVKGYWGVGIGYGNQCAQPGVAIGYANTVAGRFGCAIGIRNTAEPFAFCGGADSYALGHYSFAWGSGCITYSPFCAVFGEGTRTLASHQLVIGKYNARTSDASFMIGNGTSNTARSNSLEATVDGNLRLAGSSIKLNAFGSDPVEITADTMSKLNPVRHWVATLSKTSDIESQGQVEFWSTGTPNSTTNPTNFSDLFAKRVGKALIRSIQGSGTEYFVYGLGWLGSTGVMYHTTYPFTDGDISGVNYDSVTLSELT